MINIRFRKRFSAEAQCNFFRAILRRLWGFGTNKKEQDIYYLTVRKQSFGTERLT